MIAIPRPQETEPYFPPEARAAIAAGIRRGDAVAHLEYLGFSPRYMNLLENSSLGIITLEQLVRHSKDELLEIPGFGHSAMNQLLDCLSRYHKLPLAIAERDGPERRFVFSGDDE
jgi:DNA-directed RNA polymerase alpha subunit